MRARYLHGSTEEHKIIEEHGNTEEHETTDEHGITEEHCIIN